MPFSRAKSSDIALLQLSTYWKYWMPVMLDHSDLFLWTCHRYTQQNLSDDGIAQSCGNILYYFKECVGCNMVKK